MVDNTISCFIKGKNLKVGVKDISPLIPGDIIKAEVINISSSGNATLRIVGSKDFSPLLIPAKSEVLLNPGEVLTLKVREFTGKGVLKLEISERTDYRQQTTEDGQQIKARIESLMQKMESLISKASLKANNDLERLMQHLLKTNPNELSLTSSEMARLTELLLRKLKITKEGINERLYLLNKEGLSLRDIKDLLLSHDLAKGESIKALFENSGVLLETKVRNFMEGLVSEKEFSELLKSDLKANLLRLIEKKPINELASGLIRDIETFQGLSKINNSFYTFLPFVWDNLRDADLCFKRGETNKGDRFSCRINLNLKRYGRLSVIIVLHHKRIFTSFMVEDRGLKKIIEDNKNLLQRSFIDSGLALKAINVMAFDAGAAWSDITNGLDIKV